MQKEQLAKLLSQSQTMTQELLSLRKAILNGSARSNYPPSAQTVMSGIHHRSHLRTLAETLEANRNLVQTKKQKIQKSRIVLEGLDYFKKTLKEKIQSYHTNVESIDAYLEEPVGEINWEKDYEEGQRRIKTSLQKLRSKDETYRRSLSKKNELVKTISDKNKLYHVVMPNQVKKITEQFQEVSKIFGIEANQLLERIESSQLAYIYDSFKTLKVAEKIDVKFAKEEHEMVDIVLKPIGLQFYERALQYNIKVEEKQLKIKICHLKPDFNKLVLGVDRRSDFSNRDILHRLINREEIKPVIQQPSNESQRNLNNKFIFTSWLQNTLCVSSVKCAYFLSMLRNRAFSVSLIKHLFDTIKNPQWLSNVCPPIYNQITSKRFIIEPVQKISFNEYKQLVSLPNALKRSLNEYEAKIRRQLGEEEEQKLRVDKSKLCSILATRGLQELLLPDLYNYYRLPLSYRGLKALCICLIPFEYPDIAAKIKIISLERAGEEASNSLPAAHEHCRLVNRSPLSKEKQILEREANPPYSTLNEGLNNDPFRLVFYLSRLLSSFYGMQNSFIQCHKTK